MQQQRFLELESQRASFSNLACSCEDFPLLHHWKLLLAQWAPPPSKFSPPPLLPQRPMGQTILLYEAGAGQRHSYYSEGVEPEGGRIKIRTFSFSFSSVIISLRTLFLKILSFQGSPGRPQGL